jgi:integrase
MMSDLTSIPIDGNIPRITPWGWIMNGGYKQYRTGRWRVYVYWDKKWRYYYKDGRTPLVHVDLAKTLWMKMNSLIDRGEFDPSFFAPKTPFLFEDACETWIELSTCSDEWKRRRKKIAEKHLVPFFQDKDIRELRGIHIKKFHIHLKETGLSDKTIQNIFGELHACLNCHYDSIPKVPKFPRISVQDPVIHPLSAEQQDLIFKFIPQGDRPIFDFMRWTGCRPNEACGLLRENVNWERRQVVLATVIGEYAGVIKANTKTRKVKPLPIIPEIEEALRQKHAGRFVFMAHHQKTLIPYSKGILWRVWKRAMDLAHKEHQVPIVQMYQGLKHSFGCQRLELGFSKEQLKDIYGHTSLKTVERYAKYKTASLIDTMRGKIAQINSANVAQVQNEKSK